MLTVLVEYLTVQGENLFMWSDKTFLFWNESSLPGWLCLHQQGMSVDRMVRFCENDGRPSLSPDLDTNTWGKFCSVELDSTFPRGGQLFLFSTSVPYSYSLCLCMWTFLQIKISDAVEKLYQHVLINCWPFCRLFFFFSSLALKMDDLLFMTWAITSLTSSGLTPGTR